MRGVARENICNDAKPVNVRDDACDGDESAFFAIEVFGSIGNDPAEKKMRNWTHALNGREARKKQARLVEAAPDTNRFEKWRGRKTSVAE